MRFLTVAYVSFFLFFAASAQAWLTLNRNNKTFHAYDFYQASSSNYVAISAPVLPIPLVGPDCRLSQTTTNGTDILSAQWSSDVDKLLFYVDWDEAKAAQCGSIAQIVAQLPTLWQWLTATSYPPANGVIFSTSYSSSIAFGGPDTVEYGGYLAYTHSDISLIITSAEAAPYLRDEAIRALESTDPDLVIVGQELGPWNELQQSALFAALRWVTLGLELLLAIVAMGFLGMRSLMRTKRHPNDRTYTAAWGCTVLWLVGQMASPTGWLTVPGQTLFISLVYALFAPTVLVIMTSWWSHTALLVSPQLPLYPYRRTVKHVLWLVGGLMVLGYWLGLLIWVVSSFNPAPTAILVRIYQKVFYVALPITLLISTALIATAAWVFSPERNYFESSSNSPTVLTRRLGALVGGATLTGGVGHTLYLFLLGYQAWSSNRVTQYWVAALVRALVTLLFAGLWVAILFYLGRLNQVRYESTPNRKGSCSSSTPMVDRKSHSSSDEFHGYSTYNSRNGSTDKPTRSPSFSRQASNDGREGVEEAQAKSIKKRSLRLASAIFDRALGRRSMDSQRISISKPILTFESGPHYYTPASAPPVPAIPYTQPPTTPGNLHQKDSAYADMPWTPAAYSHEPVLPPAAMVPTRHHSSKSSVLDAYARELVATHQTRSPPPIAQQKTCSTMTTAPFSPFDEHTVGYHYYQNPGIAQPRLQLASPRPETSLPVRKYKPNKNLPPVPGGL
ncbi:hypothetical protein H4R34_004679 [Dimargaris verticillata]|uniref:Uncharacterized protein n=1 Tax=Dimargaris verticillata TaxID=2761393 RepID=A0A9W8B3U9_9FUNG|nr:hypothetical protein H4R34_004679 [Dimargaris verticillata]